MREVRGNRISMIFQEPMTSLNPVFTVGDQIGESLRLHAGLDARGAPANAPIEMLQQVGIPAPERRVDEYPHQLSGGMRQRVMIAMALACRPDILIADEPTTALDVTVQAQIFDLLRDLQRDKGTAILLITHDMGAVAEMADRVMVMYAGRVVEQGTAEQVLVAPGASLHARTDRLPARTRQQPGRGSPGPRRPGRDRRRRAFDLGARQRLRVSRPLRARHAALCAGVPPMFAVTAGLVAPGGEAGHGAACWLHATVAAEADAVSATVEPALLSVSELNVHFPRGRSRLVPGRRSRARGRRRVVRRSRAAPRWRWSANRARARPRPRWR